MCTEPGLWLGNHAFAHEKQLCNNILLHKKATQLADSVLTLIFVGNSKDIIGIIAIQDNIKANINICLKQLKNLGIMQTIMLT
ncbi:cation-transporting P-type ATPase, partial [Francisella tularensis subsp. holarctica]|nr:cation-transporting P-type ATPase [Francisella tularensis subsp. holarctica]